MLHKNTIFPLVAVLLVLCSSFAQAGAGRLRSHRQQTRSLKSSKGSIGSSSMGQPSPWRPISETTQPSPVYPLSIEGFAQKCPNQSNALDGCVALAGGGVAYQSLCKTCAMAIAHFSSVTINNLNSCSNPNFNGGYCRSCYEDVTNYYNCGTDSSLGAGTRPGGDISSDAETPTNIDEETPTNSWTGTFAPPETHCPLYAPESGDACSVEDYDYLECYFPRLKCTCRNDSPLYLCHEYISPSSPEPSQDSPETRPIPGNTPETPQEPPQYRSETRPVPGNTQEPPQEPPQDRPETRPVSGNTQEPPQDPPEDSPETRGIVPNSDVNKNNNGDRALAQQQNWARGNAFWIWLISSLSCCGQWGFVFWWFDVEPPDDLPDL